MGVCTVEWSILWSLLKCWLVFISLPVCMCVHRESKTRSLFAIRRMAMYHSEMLIPHLKAIVIATEGEVKNLRSAVSRAAIACLGDLFACLGRSLEPHMDSVVHCLLHKTGDTSMFIREDCEKALGEMASGVSTPRALMALVQGGAR